MAIEWHTLKALLAVRERGVAFDRLATIGRQHLLVDRPDLRHLYGLYGRGEGPTDARPGAYADPVFRSLGAEVVDAIDISPYEGATLLHDLNRPVPAEWRQRYDVVLDVGTLEHLFDVRVALKNEMDLVRTGGSLLVYTHANNRMGHGLYQFSPELFFAALSPENGFAVERLLLFENHAFSQWYEVSSPRKAQDRIELVNDGISVDVFVHAVKQRQVDVFETPPYQKEYVSRWSLGQGHFGPRAEPASGSGSGPGPDPAGGTGSALDALRWFVRRRWPRLAARRAERWLRRHNRARYSFLAQPDKYRPVDR